MANVADSVGSAKQSVNINATGWIAGAVIVAIVYYQFPGSRAVLQGVILLIVLGLLLTKFDVIKQQIQFIVKG